MPEYRRAFVPGGTFFFTVVVHQRRDLFRDPVAIDLLRSVLRRCSLRWPTEFNAFVLLPDHWHTIVSLPQGDDEYSKRIGWIKKEFTKHWLALGGSEGEISDAKTRQRRRGIWQPRFWEHTIEDEADFDNHFDYIHWNPVKHGHASRPKDWPHSSFRRWVERGVYSEDWASGATVGTQEPPTAKNVREAGEP